MQPVIWQPLSALQLLPVLQAQQDTSAAQQASKLLKERLVEGELAEQAVLFERESALGLIGNIVHDDVPFSKDEVGGDGLVGVC